MEGHKEFEDVDLNPTNVEDIDDKALKAENENLTKVNRDLMIKYEAL